MRTLVTFESTALNTRQARDYFINPGCFGDDTCRWLMERVHARGVSTDPEPRQEDSGWYFDFAVPEGEHCCVVGLRPAGSESEPGVWIVWIERKRTFLGSLLGGHNSGAIVVHAPGGFRRDPGDSYRGGQDPRRCGCGEDRLGGRRHQDPEAVYGL